MRVVPVRALENMKEDCELKWTGVVSALLGPEMLLSQVDKATLMRVLMEGTMPCTHEWKSMFELLLHLPSSPSRTIFALVSQ